jgi:hypothetical protein
MIMYVSLVAMTVLIGWVLIRAVGSDRVRVDEAKIRIGTVERGQFREFIPVTGTVQPIQTVFLDAPEGGTVKQRFVEDGHMVQAGERIIELSNPQLHMDAASCVRKGGRSSFRETQRALLGGGMPRPARLRTSGRDSVCPGLLQRHPLDGSHLPVGGGESLRGWRRHHLYLRSQ